MTMQEKLQNYMNERGYYDETRITQDFDGADHVQARFLDIFGDDADEDVDREPSEELKFAREYNQRKVDEALAEKQAQEDVILSADEINWNDVPEYMLDYSEMDTEYETGGVKLSYEYAKRREALLTAKELEAVMTPAEIEREFGLASGSVRNMLDGIPHRRPDERTILIPRSYAEERWAHRRLQAGDEVRVLPHTQYGDLRAGAVHSEMHSHQHSGYHSVKVVSVSTDGSVEVEIAGDMVDVVPAMYCEKIKS